MFPNVHFAEGCGEIEGRELRVNHRAMSGGEIDLILCAVRGGEPLRGNAAVTGRGVREIPSDTTTVAAGMDADENGRDGKQGRHLVAQSLASKIVGASDDQIHAIEEAAAFWSRLITMLYMPTRCRAAKKSRTIFRMPRTG